MSADPLPAQQLLAAARNLLVDQLTAQIVGLFEEAEIGCILIKGPVIADALYPGTVRPYADSDLFVSSADWDRAVALLTDHGFSDYLGPLGHPRMESMAGTAFLRGTDNIDLHATLEGLEASPEVVWRRLWEGAVRKTVGGREVNVPSQPAVLMQLALHAAKHPEQDKPVEDLRRGITHANAEAWRAAAALADDLEGLPSFVEGLRRLPEGLDLARQLGVEHVSSVRTELRSSQVPIVEGLNELFAPDMSAGERARRILTELFPNASFMRWSSPFARRGRLALGLSYPMRWCWFGAKLPAACAELVRVRRRNRQR